VFDKRIDGTDRSFPMVDRTAVASAAHVRSAFDQSVRSSDQPWLQLSANDIFSEKSSNLHSF
jgi:hypothetical protein